MFPLHENDTLSKISFYELYRDGRPVHIQIAFVLVGNNSGKYVATIHAPEIQIAHQWSVADTEQAALRETLSIIHGWTYKQIVHSD